MGCDGDPHPLNYHALFDNPTIKKQIVRTNACKDSEVPVVSAKKDTPFQEAHTVNFPERRQENYGISIESHVSILFSSNSRINNSRV